MELLPAPLWPDMIVDDNVDDDDDDDEDAA
jgi:hypothetical protein